MSEPATTNPPAAPPAAPKTIAKSKTAIAGAIVAVAGSLGTFFPNAAPFVDNHASLILLVAGVLQVVLRLATRGRVTLFAE